MPIPPILAPQFLLIAALAGTVIPATLAWSADGAGCAEPSSKAPLETLRGTILLLSPDQAESPESVGVLVLDGERKLSLILSDQSLRSAIEKHNGKRMKLQGYLLDGGHALLVRKVFPHQCCPLRGCWEP